MAPHSGNPRSAGSKPRPNWAGSREILPEQAFRRMISLEQKRSERTQRPFAVLLMDMGPTPGGENHVQSLLNTLSVLQVATRETDLMGWYKNRVSVGVLFTEITAEGDLILGAILSRINAKLRENLTAEQFGRIKFSCHLFPEELGRTNPVSKESVGLPLTFSATNASGGRGLPPG